MTELGRFISTVGGVVVAASAAPIVDAPYVSMRRPM
jgi:hypothetical protein